MQGIRPITPPVPTPGTEPFWQAAADGTLLLGRCQDCGRHHYYPRRHCPLCHGTAVEWVAASGRGRVYSLSVMRRTATPYAVAYVELEEGPRMLTNLIGPSLDAFQIGQRVALRFLPAGEMQVPVFGPDLAGQGEDRS